MLCAAAVGARILQHALRHAQPFGSYHQLVMQIIDLAIQWADAGDEDGSQWLCDRISVSAEQSAPRVLCQWWLAQCKSTNRTSRVVSGSMWRCLSRAYSYAALSQDAQLLNECAFAVATQLFYGNRPAAATALCHQLLLELDDGPLQNQVRKLLGKSYIASATTDVRDADADSATTCLKSAMHWIKQIQNPDAESNLLLVSIYPLVATPLILNLSRK